MIEVHNLCKNYGPLKAVDGVSFSVGKGEILGLLGTNGAGKSTIMRILTCFMPPSSGAVRISGFDVVEHPHEARARIGYLPESAPSYREMRVHRFLEFAAEVKGVGRRERKGAVEKVIEDLSLSSVARRVIGNLSRGYRQRVALGQALVGDPEVLILDEPTVGLDPAQVVETRALIQSMAGKRTVILSTHILPEVSLTCQKVVILHQGKQVAWGSPQHLSTAFEGALAGEATLEEVFMRAISGAGRER
jgi:ABC-2 type transport system ATP-binding protein